MRRFLVLLLILAGVAWADTWSSPDTKFSVDFPSVPAKVSENENSTVWQASVDKGVYMVAYINAPNMDKATAADQEKLTQLAGTEFLKPLGFTQASETKLADGQQYAGTVGEEKVPMTAQVRGAAAQQRIYILVAFGQADSTRLFSSFKTN